MLIQQGYHSRMNREVIKQTSLLSDEISQERMNRFDEIIGKSGLCTLAFSSVLLHCVPARIRFGTTVAIRLDLQVSTSDMPPDATSLQLLATITPAAHEYLFLVSLYLVSAMKMSTEVAYAIRNNSTTLYIIFNPVTNMIVAWS